MLRFVLSARGTKFAGRSVSIVATIDYSDSMYTLDLGVVSMSCSLSLFQKTLNIKACTVATIMNRLEICVGTQLSLNIMNSNNV